MKFLPLVFLMLICCNSIAKGIYSEPPEHTNTNSHYIFYSHGYIVQGTNPTPTHPRWGLYDYPAILETLAQSKAYIISEHRAANTNPFEHAKKLQEQVTQLIKKGVPASNISLVGFSQGGFITAITSSYLKNQRINYVILAACTSSLANHEDVTLYGNIFSMYETSDSVGSCNRVVERSGDSVVSFNEIAISTGKEHGAFYQPTDDWIKPVLAWLETQGMGSINQ